MAWEWVSLTERRSAAVKAIFAGAVAAVSVVLSAALSPLTGLSVAICGVIALQLLGGWRHPLAVWTSGGLLWVALPSIGFVWLRDRPVSGFETAMWLLILVWSVDVAAYVAGRSIGGPKLAPRISPKKTWAGLLGGTVAAIVVGILTASATHQVHWWQLAFLSGVLGIVEQIGDIAESYAKRKFGAKDSSALIPGHGGLLDRLDGMLAVVAFVTLLGLVAGDVIR